MASTRAAIRYAKAILESTWGGELALAVEWWYEPVASINYRWKLN
jgi:hypothetical protein